MCQNYIFYLVSVCVPTPCWHSLLGESARSKKSIFLPQWQTNFFPSTNHHRRTKYKREHWKLIRSEPFYTTCDAAILCCWVWVEVVLLLLMWCFIAHFCLLLGVEYSNVDACFWEGEEVKQEGVQWVWDHPCYLITLILNPVCYCLLLFVTVC